LNNVAAGRVFRRYQPKRNLRGQPAESDRGADGEVCMFYEITLLNRLANADLTNLDGTSLRFAARRPDHPSSIC
jgi:hypothetical protein